MGWKEVQSLQSAIENFQSKTVYLVDQYNAVISDDCKILCLVISVYPTKIHKINFIFIDIYSCSQLSCLSVYKICHGGLHSSVDCWAQTHNASCCIDKVCVYHPHFLHSMFLALAFNININNRTTASQQLSSYTSAYYLIRKTYKYLVTITAESPFLF